MIIGLLGQKIGMTSVYDAKGRLCPVTVIAAGDNVLLRRLTEENESYSAVQVGFAAQKESRVTKPLLGEFKKAGVGPQKFVREFRLAERSSRRRDQFKRYAIPSGRLCRCDWPIEGKRISGRDEEAQFSWPRRGARFENAPAHRRSRQSVHARTDLEKPRHAGPSRR